MMKGKWKILRVDISDRMHSFHKPYAIELGIENTMCVKIAQSIVLDYKGQG